MSQAYDIYIPGAPDFRLHLTTAEAAEWRRAGYSVYPVATNDVPPDDKPDPDHIMQAIQRERAYQNKKYGSIAGRAHSVASWILIAEIELEEAKQAWQKEAGNTEALRELLQVAAVIVACLEQYGVVERPGVFDNNSSGA
jgi:hypothetical protein